MAARGLDLYLTSGPENVFYLSGQQTPGYYTFQCLAVPAAGEPFHVIRGLEAMNARANTYLADISGYPDDANPAAAVAQVLAARGFTGKRVAVDQNAWFLTVNLHQRLVKEFGPLEDASGLVEELRRVKSPLELQQMAEAARANDAGMRAGLEATRAGASENDVAAAIMGAAIRAGSEYVGMEPFVTSGPRSGIPHTTWRRRRIEPGDVVILETSACYNRYHAALYRTVAIGKIPEGARDMYRVCEEGLAAAMAELRPGRTCADVHQAAQAVVDRHGYTFGYRKRTGYSIGISFAPDWGEGNILSLYRGVDVALVPGMVFHVPITLREYARWTVAVSETVLVTPEGARRLSALPAGLLER
jgi:Xaa-Pro dipeptidase